MRCGTRPSLVVTAVLALLVGVTPAVLGQSEEPLDPMGANYWTGTWTYVEDSAISGDETTSAGITETRGSEPGVVAADDPRIQAR